MLNYFRAGIANFELRSQSGVAAGVKTWSETHVYGGGGANNSNVTIGSSAITQNAFFLVDDNGKEASSTIPGNIPLRDGHFVTVVYIKRTGHPSWYPTYFKNHSSGDERFLGGLALLTGQSGCLTIILLVIACYVVGLSIGSLLFASFGRILPLMGLVAAVVLVISRNRTLKATKFAVMERSRDMAADGERKASIKAPRLS